jgi:nuclear pore complex protein Nup93
MLARAQVDTSQLTRTLNQLQPTAAFTALQPHHDNDLAFLSKQAHESALISCIEEGRRRTVNDFYTNMRQEMIRDWDRKKFQVLEDLARHHPALVSTEGMTDAPGTPTGTPQQRRRSMSAARRTSGNQFEPYSQSLFNQQPAASGTSELHMHAKMMKYDHAVARINGFRKRDAPVATLTVLADAATSTASQNNTVRSLCKRFRFSSRDFSAPSR